MSSLRQILVCVLIAASLVGCGDDDPSLPAAASATLRKWQRFEVTLPRSVSETNPYDPNMITVDGEFRAPSGETIVMPAFVSRDYERSLVGGFEKLRALGELQWKVRFTPTQEGRWSWQWRVTTPASVEVLAGDSFDVIAPAIDAHGFVRRSARDGRYLEFDDGTSYWAIGENLAWYDGRGTYAYDDWFAKLAAQGCNYVRLWMPSWAFGLEWIERDGSGAIISNSLGNYTDRLNRAWQLDHVIEAAERHGIYLMLAIQYHGAFSLTSNTEWSNNPYNAANGGPLTLPRELFTDPQAIELVQRRLRYIVARWGYAPSIMTWELWNEADLTDQPSPDAMAAWHRDMARELIRLDPHDRLISTSTAARDQLAAVWQLPEIDYTQIHFYAFEGLSIDFPAFLPGVAARFRRFSKPVLFGEVGVDLAGPAETLRRDPYGDGFHDILWTGLISETFGTGMSWWWDNVVDPQDYYFHFGPIAAFTRAVDFPGEGFRLQSTRVDTTDGHNLRVFDLQGTNTHLIWIKNAAHNWYSPDPSLVEGARINVTGLGTARWRATLLDSRSGERVVLDEVVAGDAAAAVSLPPFRRDVALRLDRVP